MAIQPVKANRAEPAEYRKHPVVKKWTRWVVAATKNGEAVFMPGLPKTPKEYAMLYSDPTQSHPIPAGSALEDVALYWLKMDYDVGASRGIETPFILIKRDAGKVHARPISMHELRHTFKVQVLKT